MLDPKKLADAVKVGYRALDGARKARSKNISIYLGTHSGHEHDEKDEMSKRPLNLVASMVDTVRPLLVPAPLRARVRARRASLFPAAHAREIALNHLFEELNLVERYREMVEDAMLGPMGVLLVGMKAAQKMVEADGAQFDPGKPFVARVDFDDYVIDPDARCYAERLWEGHKFRVGLNAALESGVFAGQEDRLRGLTKVGERNERGDASGERVIDQIELWSVTVYDSQIPRTFILAPSDDGGEGEPLAETEFDGPDGGPYVTLCFRRHPRRAIGAPGVSVIRDLADGMDSMGRKLIRQASRAKNIGVAKRGKRDDALQVRDASDGDMILVDDPEAVKSMSLNGVIDGLIPLVEFLMGHANNLSGNTQLLGGGGQVADTATEATILQGNANTKLQEMRERMNAVQKRVARYLGWYLDTDPLIQLPLTTRLPGGEYIDLAFDAATRQGEFADFNYDVQISSSPAQNPELRLARMMEGIGKLVELASAPPGAFNLTTAASIFSRELNVDELDQVVNDPLLQGMNEQMLAPTNAMAGQGQPQQTQQTQQTGPTTMRGAQQQAMAPAMQGGANAAL